MTAVSFGTLSAAVPDVDAHAAHRDAQRLRRAGVQARVAGERVGGTAPSQWYGGAWSAFDVARAELSGFLVDVAVVASRASEALSAYADAAPAAVRRMQAAADDYAAAVRVLELDPASDRAPVLRDEAVAAFEAAKRQYRASVDAAIDALSGLPELASPPSQGPGRHVGAAASRFWSESVAAPATFAWQLTGGFFQDRDGWQAMVAALPGAYLDMARHPVRMAKDAVAWDDWASGEWGAAAGTGLGMAVGGGGIRKAVAPDVASRFARNMASPDAPRPPTQTFDQMLMHTDLDSSEHAELGHALRRHVDVDDDYLQDRLLNGTLEDDATRGARTSSASVWADRATAERVITETLRHREFEVRQWLAAPGEPTLRIDMPTDSSVGDVMRRDADGFYSTQPRRSVVVLALDGEQLYIKTAYPDPKDAT